MNAIKLLYKPFEDGQTSVYMQPIKTNHSTVEIQLSAIIETYSGLLNIAVVVE